MTRSFGTVITAMATPFTSDDQVNYSEAIRLAKYLVNTGTTAIVLAGTTGESPTLTHDEEFRLFREIKAAVGNRVPIIAGTGSNCTRTAIESTVEAESIGVDGVLQVVPYYNRPSQEGLYQHFKAVAAATRLPIILYNIPGRTGRNMEPETAARLAQISNIIGIKEAAGSIEQVKSIRAATPPDFLIYSGDDGLTLDFMQEGACGVVSVASHLAGSAIANMIDSFAHGDSKKARTIESGLKELFEILFITTNPTPLKAALEMIGFSMGKPRLPLVEATDDERIRIEAVLKKMGLLQTVPF
ncbi:4-hydroxy-tetrahydrodipicolinate synthase [bacterium]|nr:4-hydroxy-tetrahydrodipicolinate synthase [bacterium]